MGAQIRIDFLTIYEYPYRTGVFVHAESRCCAARLGRDSEWRITFFFFFGGE